MRRSLFFVSLALLQVASATVYLASDFESGDSESQFYTRSEGVDFIVSGGFKGQGNYSIVADLGGWNKSDVWHGLDSPQGIKTSFRSSTPEYDLRVTNATNFFGTSRLSRESEVIVEEEVITESNDSLVQTTETTFTKAQVETNVRGNGDLKEDISISYPGKARTLKLRELDFDGKNFSLQTNLSLSGQQIKRDFGVLNESEAFDKVILPTEDTVMRV